MSPTRRVNFSLKCVAFGLDSRLRGGDGWGRGARCGIVGVRRTRIGPPGRDRVPGATIFRPPGRDRVPGATTFRPPGRDPVPGDTTFRPPGRDRVPGGTTFRPPGRHRVPGATTFRPPGRDRVPGGTTFRPPGRNCVSGGTTARPLPRRLLRGAQAGCLKFEPCCRRRRSSEFSAARCAPRETRAPYGEDLAAEEKGRRNFPRRVARRAKRELPTAKSLPQRQKVARIPRGRLRAAQHASFPSAKTWPRRKKSPEVRRATFAPREARISAPRGRPRPREPCSPFPRRLARAAAKAPRPKTGSCRGEIRAPSATSLQCCRFRSRWRRAARGRRCRCRYPGCCRN
jgi:hypothetical protein